MGQAGGKMALFWHLGQDEELEEAEVEKVFPFLQEKNHVISLVGGGGKTTLMYFLADRFSRKGCRTIVTTTTHIFMPEQAGRYAKDCEQAVRLWEDGSYAVIGSPAEHGKLTMPSGDLLHSCMELADIVLAEADGAKRLPCKVPAEHEPVILPESDVVIGVMGMKAFGKSLKDVCFRYEHAMRLLKTESEGHCLTAEDMAQILSSESGTRKYAGQCAYYAAVNQCDTQEQRQAGREILKMLNQTGISGAVLAKLKSE